MQPTGIPARPIRVRFLPLIWSGIWRKPGRSVLIFLQVSVAFALFGVLQGMKTGVDRLIVVSDGVTVVDTRDVIIIVPPLPPSGGE